MTLFVRTENRLLQISDAYVMALAFVISFILVKVLKKINAKALKKNDARRKKGRSAKLPHHRGGSLNLKMDYIDDAELGDIILSCIADGNSYLVVDENIKNLIFNLVKAKVKNESLILTPNFLRYLAVRLINQNQVPVAIQIGSAVIASENPIRLGMRTIGSFIMGGIAAFFTSMLPYALLVTINYFTLAEGCGRPCDEYFKVVSPDEPIVKVFQSSEQAEGQLFIEGNDEARQLAIYVPTKPESDSEIISTVADTAIDSDAIQVQITRTREYRRERKMKAKMVKFSDFRRTDPELRLFDNLEEPEVPQKQCPIDIDNLEKYTAE